MSVQFFSYGNNVMIDDCVFPDGQTRMGQLGGGSMFAVLGMRMWSRQIGIVSGIGQEYIKQCEGYLEHCGIDIQGLLVRDMPTPRAWQIFEWNEQRTEIFRTSLEQFVRMLPTPLEVPFSYRFVVGIHTFDFGDVTLVKELRRHFPKVILAWEPYLPFGKDLINRDAIFDTLSLVDAFLPNFSEACRLCRTEDINCILSELLETGVKTVAIRMGREGSIVSTKRGKSQQIPIYPTRVIDVAGAGNAYSGAFLVEYAKSGDPLNAGLCGTVAASFTIEQVGLPVIIPNIEKEAEARYRWLRDQIG